MKSKYFEHATDPVDPKLFAFDQECMGPDVEDLLRRANPSEASGQ